VERRTEPEPDRSRLTFQVLGSFSKVSNRFCWVMAVGVGVAGKGVEVGVRVLVGVGVFVGVEVGGTEAAAVGVRVNVGASVAAVVGVRVEVAVGVEVGVGVWVRPGRPVAVEVGVRVGVRVTVGVFVGADVPPCAAVGVRVGVGEGEALGRTAIGSLFGLTIRGRKMFFAFTIPNGKAMACCCGRRNTSSPRQPARINPRHRYVIANGMAFLGGYKFFSFWGGSCSVNKFARGMERSFPHPIILEGFAQFEKTARSPPTFPGQGQPQYPSTFILS
jgi:hypothetical protein